MKMGNGVINEKPSLLLFDFDVVCGNSVSNEDLPNEYILPKDRIPNCYNQEWTNQCTCFAACNILEILYYIKHGVRKRFSTTFMYGRHRGEHLRTMDCGSPKGLMKWLTMLGSIPYEMMPKLMANPEAYDYVREQDLEKLDRIASETAIDSYIGMNSACSDIRIPQIKKALLTYGYPIWVTYETGKTESHAVALIGWTQNKFIFMNSWGTTKYDDGIHKVSWDRLNYAYLFLTSNNKPNFPFVDVTEDQWFYHAIHRCYNAGIINGVDGTHFAPDDVLTKAQVAQALYKMAIKHSDFNGNEFKGYKDTIHFTDVKKNQWFYDAINYCVGKNIFKEKNGEFKPDSYITRAEFCRAINAYINGHCNTKKMSNQLKRVNCTTIPFIDVLKDEELYNDILKCYALGVINGVDETHFEPNGTLTRAQLCQMIYNFIKVVEEVEGEG